MLNIFVLFAFTIVAVSGENQHACIFGQLVCSTNSSVAMDADIKMLNINWGDRMGETTTDKSGLFALCASTDYFIFSIDPYVNIYHSCNAKPGCTRMYEQQVPHKKVFSDGDVLRMFAMGVIDLTQEGSHKHECQPIERSTTNGTIPYEEMIH